MKKTAIIVLVIALVFAFAGCSKDKPVSRRLPDDDSKTVYTITGDISVENDGSTVKVLFNSNLITGTIVKVSIDTYDGKNLYEEKYSITGSDVKFEIPMNEKWKGNAVYVSVVASPSTGRQPSEVRDAYGRLFQFITGDNVIWDKSDNICLFQTGKIQF